MSKRNPYLLIADMIESGQKINEKQACLVMTHHKKASQLERLEF